MLKQRLAKAANDSINQQSQSKPCPEQAPRCDESWFRFITLTAGAFKDQRQSVTACKCLTLRIRATDGPPLLLTTICFLRGDIGTLETLRTSEKLCEGKSSAQHWQSSQDRVTAHCRRSKRDAAQKDDLKMRCSQNGSVRAVRRSHHRVCLMGSTRLGALARSDTASVESCRDCVTVVVTIESARLQLTIVVGELFVGQAPSKLGQHTSGQG